MRSPALLSSWLILPLLAACPGDDGPAAPTASTTDDPTAADTSTTTPGTTSPPPDTGTEAETSPPLDTGTGSTTVTDTDTDTNGGIPGCECILDEDLDSYDPPAAPLCGDLLCGGAVGAECSGKEICDPELEPKPFTVDAEALDCALAALRDRTPGVVRWSYSELGGQNDDAGYVLVKDDGTAVRRSWGWQDLTFFGSDAVLGELPPPAHFDGCLADPSPMVRFDCLRGQLETELAVCDEGWSYEDL